MLLVCLSPMMAGQAAGAATLGQVLDKLSGNPAHGNPANDRPDKSAPCLEVVAGGSVPARLPLDRCAAQTVGDLYLGLLRDRERLRIVRAAIAAQRGLLSLVQKRIAAGSAPSDAFLLADIELNHWQIEEARLIGNLLHVELFFRSVVGTDPSQMVRPHFAPSAFPADEAGALALLAQEEAVPPEEQPVLRNLLQHAWIDYKAAEREIALLQPMGAAAADVAKASRQRYARGQTRLADLHARLREATRLHLALVTAQYQLLVAQFRILEMLDRRSAIE